MIACLLLAVMAAAPLPLPATTSRNGVYFVNDHPPGESGPPHALSALVGEEAWTAIMPLEHRPAAIASAGNQLWFADIHGGSADIYLMRLGSTTPLRSRMVATIAVGSGGIDLTTVDGNLVVATFEEGLHLQSLIGGQWSDMPTPPVLGNAHLNTLAGAPVVAEEVGGSVRLWHWNDDTWIAGGEYAVEGHLRDLVIRDAWPLLLMEEGNTTTLIALQQDGGVDLAAWTTPPGRWAVLPTQRGLLLLGVERRGRVTATPIGWPSGDVGEAHELDETTNSPGSLLTVISTALMVAAVLAMMLTFRRGGQRGKKGTKTDSGPPPTRR